MTSGRSPALRVAAFCTELGHLGTLGAVLAGLASRGHRVTLHAPAELRRQAESLGIGFDSLYEMHPIERVDDRSIPVPCRAVSHAGIVGAEIVREFERARPDLIVYDTFAVLGRLVGHALGVPHVAVWPVHRLSGTEAELRAIAESRRVVIDPACETAVDVLRNRHGLRDAHPFWYLSARSPHLNVYCEPPAFLPEEDRARFAPLAFFGSLPWSTDPSRELERAAGARRVCIAFGGVVWRYFAPIALETIRRVAGTLREHRGAEVTIGLGGWRDAPREWTAELESRGVTVRQWIDQTEVLRRSDVFVTHHGLKSVHEAILHGVPMLSFPFFSDQPALAERCRELGLAEAVCAEPRSIPEEHEILAAFDRLEATMPERRRRLDEARGWELATLRERGAVIERIVALARAETA